MGMLGVWLSKPRGFTDYDDFFNRSNLTERELNDVIADIDAGKLWLEIRHQRGFAPSALGATTVDSHICEHWYNQNDEGWWPLEPSEEIRTEALRITCERVRASLQNKEEPRKHVSSYWLCPGARYFQVGICESDGEIAIFVLTPPEGKDPTSRNPEKESEHRPDYVKFVDQLVTGTEDTAGLWTEPGKNEPTVDKFLVRAMRETIDELKNRYKPGLRVRLTSATVGSRPIYRTILGVNSTQPDGLIVQVRAGRGPKEITIPSEPFTSFVIEYTGRKDLIENDKFKKEQMIWTVSRDDLGSGVDTKVIIPKVVGTSVRQHLNDHIPSFDRS